MAMLSTMASSELEIEPDLNKAPPHVEGELLKQNSKAIVGNKGWKKYYFIVLRDKLQFFRRREDYKNNREPIGYVRMSQVMEITEVVFDGVPKKHHLNSGFTIVSFHPVTREQQSFNLLAETPEDMRYWVHALRYIKAYWSKLEVRETVLSEEQERKLLDRILSEEDDERDILVGEIFLNEDGQVSSTPEQEPKIVPVVVYFADGSKVTIKLSPLETTSHLLESVKDKLSSSATQLWLVDNQGQDLLLEPKDHPALYQPKAYRFYALDPSHRVLVIFYNIKRDFESITVPTNSTAREVIEHRDVSIVMDITGITNRGLFLKNGEEEQIFGTGECPCEVLFEVDASGKVTRLPVGHLLVRNKAVGFTMRRTQKPRFKSIYNHNSMRRNPNSDQILEEKAQEEDAQTRALDMLIQKKKNAGGSAPKSHMEWLPSGLPAGFNTDHRNSAPELDQRGFEETVCMNSEEMARTFTLPTCPEEQYASRRPRSSAVVGESSPVVAKRRVHSSVGEVTVPEIERTRRLSPSPSPTTTAPNQPVHRSRSKSPRRLPDIPPRNETSPSLARKNATRARGSNRGSPVARRGPTIVLTGGQPQNEGPSEKSASLPTSLTPRSPTIIRKSDRGKKVTASVVESMMGDLKADNARSSAFGVTSPIPINLTPEMVFRNRSVSPNFDDERLDRVFSRSYQQEQDELKARNYRAVDTLTSKYQAVSREAGMAEEAERGRGGSQEGRETRADHKSPSPSDVEGEPQPPRPMVIDFTKLTTPNPPPTESTSGTLITVTTKPYAPVDILTPSLLKLVRLQAPDKSSSSLESRPMDFISLSGVCLRNDRGIWRMQEGCNFHDPLPLDCEDHTESFPLPGGIRAIYNHTHKRWHVLPPPMATPSGDDSRSEVDSTEQTVEEQDARETPDLQERQARLFLQKKRLVTDMGVSFQEILSQFEQTRDAEEKKRIGSDMMNISIGHMIRGKFCSTVARLLLDGMKPYRMEGLVVDDIWKITTAFCQEAQSNHTSPLVFLAFDKLILQPINSLKTLQDKNVQFRTFVCLAMSKGMLTNWLEALPKQQETIRKHYLPTAFIHLAMTSEPYQKLFQEMLLTLEPLTHLPFNLSIDFEVKQAEQPQTQLQPPESTQEPQGEQQQQPPLRTSVVIKTHAATGQKTGNVISAVWQTPVEARGEAGSREETDSSKANPSTMQALRDIQERQQTVTPPTKNNWFKKFTTSLQQINAGGAITGPPKSYQQQRLQQEKRLSPSKEKRVEALYKSIAEDADELSFNKGDILIVKEQINEEWLICAHGVRSGIVPVNYVKPLL